MSQQDASAEPLDDEQHDARRPHTMVWLAAVCVVVMLAAGAAAYHWLRHHQSEVPTTTGRQEDRAVAPN